MKGSDLQPDTRYKAIVRNDDGSKRDAAVYVLFRHQIPIMIDNMVVVYEQEITIDPVTGAGKQIRRHHRVKLQQIVPATD